MKNIILLLFVVLLISCQKQSNSIKENPGNIKEGSDLNQQKTIEPQAKTQTNDKTQAQEIKQTIDSILKSMTISTIKPGKEIILSDFNISNLNGDSAKLLSSIEETNSKVIILNIYATWCPYCKKEMNALNTLHNKVDKLSVIALDSGEKQSDVKDFMSKNFSDLTYPILIDEKNILMMSYGFNSLPTTLILDKNHRIIGVRVGYMDWEDESVVEGFTKLVNIYE